jgi:hypothetical protein
MKKLLVIGLAALGCGGCYYDKYQEMYPTVASNACDTTTTPSTYSGNVQKIMSDNCATTGCHNTSTAAASLDLTQYNTVKTISLDGRMLRDIVWTSTASHRMPKGGSQMSDCNIKQVLYWVNKGAPQN